MCIRDRSDTRMPRTLRVRGIRPSEVQLLTVSRSGAVCRANVGLDLLAGVAVDVLPVVDRFLEYFAADPAEKMTSHVGDELGPLRVVPDLAHQGAGLTEVVILSVQLVGRAHHWTCLLYTSDAADDLTRVDLGGRRIIKKKKQKNNIITT